MTNAWTSCPKPNPNAPVKLFCFPYAGAGASMFNKWGDALPAVELHLIHLPGRDSRIREPLRECMYPLVEQLAEGLLPLIGQPYAFFGHSMGGLISFETARQLRRMQAPQPVHLFISSRRAPHLPDPYANLYLLPDAQFLKATELLYGALPDAVRLDPDVLHLFLKIMRADFTLLGTHRCPVEPPLDFPISVFGGLQDKSVAEYELQAWREQTTASFQLKMLPGDHSLFQTARAALLQCIAQWLVPSH